MHQLKNTLIIICRFLGGALCAIGLALACLLPTSYAEWEHLPSALTFLAVGSLPLLPGLVLMTIGAGLDGSPVFKPAQNILTGWLLAAGSALTLSPIFNLIWMLINGASFAAPYAPVLPFLFAIVCGALFLTLAARRLNLHRLDDVSLAGHA